MQKPTDAQIKATLDQIEREAKAAHASVERRFSQDQRRRMFFTIAQNQVAAKREALRRIPRRVDRLGMEQADRTMKRSSVENDLIAQADRKSQRQLRITKAEMSSIQVEGMQKRWPMPSFRL